MGGCPRRVAPVRVAYTDCRGLSSSLRWAFIVMAAFGCSVQPNIEGKPCPCAPGFRCEIDRCVRADVAPSELPNGTGDSGSQRGDLDASTSGDGSIGRGDAGPQGGLVAWYRLDENTPRDGVLDSSGNDLHGACVPETTCPMPIDGVVDGAFSFDGVDDVIRVPHDGLFATSSGFTIAVWARQRFVDMQDLRMVVSKPFGEGTLNSWEIYFFDWRTGTVRLHFALADESSDDRISVLPEFSPGEWTHLAGTWDGAQAEFWVNGESVGVRSDDAVRFDEGDVLIGSDARGENAMPGSWFNGDIDDFRVYRRALSEEELLELVAEGAI